MAAATGAATAAAGQAASSVLDPVDLVNVPAGFPAQEIYPGAVTPAQYEDPGAPPQPRTGPVVGEQQPQIFATPAIEAQPGGGGVQDLSDYCGHDAPQVAWDSSAGQPFAPSGSLDPVLHGEDTGGVYRDEHVIPAAIGSLTRTTDTAQTYNRLSATQSTIGQTEPNGRTNLDQAQYHNPEGYQPWEIPYSERPIQNNLAYEAMPVTAGGSGLIPDGSLPDRSPYDYAAQAYEAPPDPDVSVVPAGTGTGNIGGGFLLG